MFLIFWCYFVTWIVLAYRKSTGIIAYCVQDLQCDINFVNVSKWYCCSLIGWVPNQKFSGNTCELCVCCLFIKVFAIKYLLEYLLFLPRNDLKITIACLTIHLRYSPSNGIRTHLFTRYLYTSFGQNRLIKKSIRDAIYTHAYAIFNSQSMGCFHCFLCTIALHSSKLIFRVVS